MHADRHDTPAPVHVPNLNVCHRFGSASSGSSDFQNSGAGCTVPARPAQAHANLPGHDYAAGRALGRQPDGRAQHQPLHARGGRARGRPRASLIHLPEAPLPSFTGALRHQPNVREVTPPCAMQSHTVCWPTGLPAWLVRARGALCMAFSTSDASGALAEEGASWVGRAIRACVLSSALP